MGSSKMITLVASLITCYMFTCVTSTEFVVGGEAGWVVPNKTHGDMYNQWASKNRFKIDDTIRFKYEKDAVAFVSEEEYKNCNATKPVFYANNDDTVFRLDHAGLFYFISGVSGHCEKGQKMIIKVMEIESTPDSPPPSSSSSSSNSSSSSTPSSPDMAHKKSNALKTSSSRFVAFAIVVLVCGLV